MNERIRQIEQHLHDLAGQRQDACILFGADPARRAETLAVFRDQEAQLRRERAAIEAETERQRTAARRAGYAAARQAAIEDGLHTARDESRPALMAQRHVVDLAVEHDAAITWMSKRSAVTKVAGGLCFFGARQIIAPAIVDTAAYAVALHELGHLMHARSLSTINREIAAWRWAVGAARWWDASATARMRHALETNIAESLSVSDERSILAAEQFLGEAGEIRFRGPSERELEYLAQQLFEEVYGLKRCGARCCTEPYAAATQLVGSTFCCKACAPLVEASIARNRRVAAPVRPTMRHDWREIVMPSEQRTTETRASMEHATTRRGAAPLLAVGDELRALEKGELRCATCGAKAVSVRGIGGKHRPLCASPTCRENARLDAQVERMKRRR